MQVLLSFDEELSRRLPLPLAQLYQRAHNAKAGIERHHAAYYLWEASLKLLASTSLSVYASLESRDPELSRLLENLARPSLGHWWEFARRLGPFLSAAPGGDPGFRAIQELVRGRARSDLPRAAGLEATLRDALELGGGARTTVRVSDLFDLLVQYRNREFGHGAAGQRPTAFYDRMGRVLLTGIAEVLRHLDPLAGRELLYIADVRLERAGGWLVERFELTGEAPRRLETLEVSFAEAASLPRPGRIYLQRPGASAGASPPGNLISLHPLALYDPDSQEFFFLNARRGQERCEYLSYGSGRLSQRQDLGADHRALLASLLGVPVEEGEALRWAERSCVEERPAQAGEEAGEEAPAARRLGEFELVSRIGRGGMGAVFRAWQPSLGRQVALKCLFSAGDPKVEARFAREIQALGRVEHPHLVKIFTSGTDGDQWFYAMELVEGADLAQVCEQLAGSSASEIGESDWRRAVSSAGEKAREKEEPLTPGATAGTEPGTIETGTIEKRKAVLGTEAGRFAKAEAGYIRHVVEVIRQTAAAAHALHEAGVVHRDIKPGNIMLAAGGTDAVLMDLGLAQLADDAQGRLTRTRQFVGTLRYASPEQLLATGALDRRSDVYSLGATLWELLTLRPLFGAGEGTPTPELMLKIQSEEPERPRRHNPRLPADLEAVVLRCLEKNPARRYPSAAELAADLDRWLRGEPVQAQPPTLTYLLGKFVRRHRMRLAAAAALLLFLLALAVVSIARIHQAHRRAQLTVFDLYTASGLEATAQMNYSRAILWFGRAATVPHGDPERESSNRVRLGAWNAEAPFPVRALFLEGQAVRGMQFHPGGTHLLIQGPEDRCLLWNLDEEAPSPLPGGDAPVSAAAWSPGGDLLALGRPGGEVDLLGFPEGSVLHRLPGTPGRASALAFSPDGRLLAIGNDHARIWDRERQAFAGNPIVHPAPVRWLAFGSGGDRLLTAAADDRARVFAVSGNGAATGPLFEPVRHLINSAIAGLSRSDVPWFPALLDGGRVLLTVTTPTEVTWWDGVTGAVMRRISAVDRLTNILPSPDGRWVALVDVKKAQLWDVLSERPEGSALEPSGRLPAAWSPDSSSFFLSGDDSQVRGWEFHARKPVRTFSLETRPRPAIPHHAGVVSLVFSPSGEFLATAQADGLVRLWRTGSEAPPRRRHLPPSLWQGGIAVSRDGRYVMTLGRNDLRPTASTRLFEIETGSSAGPPLLVAGALDDAGFSPDGTRVHTVALLEGGTGGGETPAARIEFWDWRSGERISQVAVPSSPTHWSYSADGSRLAVRCAGGQVLVVDPVTGRTLGGPKQRYPEREFAFAPGAEHCITWARGETPRIWKTATGEERRPGLEGEVRCRRVQFAEDGSLLITVSVDHAVQIWEFRSGRLLSPELGHGAPVQYLDLEDDKLLVAGADQTVRLWNWRSGQPIGAPLEHRSDLRGAAFLGLQRGWIITLSAADGLRVWESRAGRLLAPPRPVAIDLERLSLVGEIALLGPVEAHDLSELKLHEKERALGARDWERLGELLAGETIQEGGAVHLESEEWMRRWRAFREEHPERFPGMASRERTLGWHRARAAALEGELDLDAAAWHLARLGLALNREDRRLDARVRSYVRSWHFAPRAFPWQSADAGTLDLMDPQALQAIVESARSARPVRARGPYVDFLAQYPEYSSLARGYALRIIQTPQPRRIHLLAGSDDTLRLWLNGKEVFGSPGVGPAIADHRRIEVDLGAGENVLLVEVGQSGGDWGLYLRLEDAGGRKLHLGDTGLLEPLEED